MNDLRDNMAIPSCGSLALQFPGNGKSKENAATAANSARFPCASGTLRFVVTNLVQIILYQWFAWSLCESRFPSDVLAVEICRVRKTPTYKKNAQTARTAGTTHGSPHRLRTDAKGTGLDGFQARLFRVPQKMRQTGQTRHGIVGPRLRLRREHETCRFQSTEETK